MNDIRDRELDRELLAALTREHEGQRHAREHMEAEREVLDHSSSLAHTALDATMRRADDAERERDEARVALAAATARAVKAEKERDEADSTASFVLRPEVAAFAMLMEEKLLLNDHRPGWKNDDVHALIARLYEEARELVQAIGEGVDPAVVHAEIGREAADVANFAMMIADVCGALDEGVLRARARTPISEADVARVATVAIHAVADVKDAQIATLIAERDEARGAWRDTVADALRMRDAADTTRREWEVMAAESFKVGRDVGRSTALADVTRAITELGVDVPTDALPLVMDIADMIAKADRESYATGRAAGLREAASVLTGESVAHRKLLANVRAFGTAKDRYATMAARDALETVAARILALALPAAETVRTETIFGCRTCPASTPGWSDGRFASPGWGRIAHIDGPNAICPVCAADPTSLDCLREEDPNVAIAAEPRDEGEA